MSEPAVFELVGRRFVPTDLALGPWRDGALHGGAVSALLARLVERAEPGDRWVTRLTVDLLGPVPLAPLDAEVTLTRTGRKVDVVQATLAVDGTTRAAATGVRVRPVPTDVPAGAAPPEPTWPLPDDGEPPADAIRNSSPFFSGLDFRLLAGRLGVPGPATSWCRFEHRLVAGEDNSPLVGLAAAADNVYGIGSPIRVADWLYVNVDLSLHLHRPPEGDWVLLDAVMHLGPGGTALARATVADLAGVVGHAVQDVVVTPRDRAARSGESG